VIPLDPRQHRAQILPDGSIVLPSEDMSEQASSDQMDPSCQACKESTQQEHEEQSTATGEETVVWEVTSKQQEDSQAQEATVDEAPHGSAPQRRCLRPKEAIALLQSGKLAAYRTAMSAMEESARQYKMSAADLVAALRSARSSCGRMHEACWGFLSQPVWIIRKNAEPKRYSRGTLFVLDTVRFGCTFAALFTAIFLTLNYQSFWEIVRSNARPIQSIQSAQDLASTVDEALRDKLLKSPSLAVAGRAAGDLLSFLPEVGPPDNRVIIPKLNLNVPLVTPSYQNLLQENWVGVETDIQDALQHGIVHYPGTARPGQAGNFFVTGHSSYYPWAPGHYKNVFARLHELAVGDEYWVFFGGDRHRYRIVQKKEVKSSDVTVLDQPVDRRTATLMTCTPVGTTLRRLIVTAEEIDPITGESLAVGEHGGHSPPKLNVEQLPI